MPWRYVIGVDIGESKLAAGVVDQNLRVHQRAKRLTHGLQATALLKTVQDTVQELVNQAPGPVGSVGIASSSLIDERSGSLLAEHLDLPVLFGDEGSAAALAEHRAGAGRGSDRMLLLMIGAGIGGGLILDGELYRGGVGSGAELGRVTIKSAGALAAGKHGARDRVESLASGAALTQEATRIATEQPASGPGKAHAAGRELSPALVTELAHDGDSQARAVITLIGSRLGVALASYVSLFTPEVIVLSGEVMAAGEMLLGPARAAYAEHALSPSRGNVRVMAAHFGTEAAMIGAAALALTANHDPAQADAR